MQVDDRIETRIREAYSAAIAKDGNRMAAAFEGLDEAGSALAARLGVFVVGFIMKHAFGHNPSSDDAEETARDTIEWAGSWVDLGPPEEVAGFLLSAARADTSFPGVPKEDIIGLTFVCGAYLLASRSLETQRWYEYLDEIWNALEAAPEPMA